MKLSLVALLAFAVFVSSSVIPVHKDYKVVKDKQWLEKQKQVLELFGRIHHDIPKPEFQQVAETWDVEEHASDFTKPEVVTEFFEWYHNDLLRQREIFSVFNERHLQQAISLFKLFYYAKDYETFYKTAVWARQTLNRPMWVYSFSVAVVHRPDTKGILLPPIWEVEPNYFFASEVIHEAQYYKQVHDESRMDKTDKEYHGYTIDANYSGHYLNLHPEQSLSYMMEDIGFSASHYYYNIFYPTWMKNGEYGMVKDRRGAMEYFRLQQVAARFYQERLSNGWGEIPVLDYEEPIETPYYSSLVYPNGLQFPNRPRFAKLHDYFYNYGQKTSRMYRHSFEMLKDIQQRIVDVADSGIVFTEDGEAVKLDKTTEEGLSMLGNIIIGNADSVFPEYYGKMQWYIRHLLGYAPQPFDHHRVVASALEHLETTRRDPIYYQILKEVLSYFRRYYRHIPAYTKKDLSWSAVEITDVEVDKLITYMDYYYSDLANAVFYNPQEKASDFHVRVRQQRLNHKPFTYKLHVKSDKDQKVVVKTFLGPKYDEYGRYLNLTQNHLNFVELDKYVYEMKSGENVIERNSNEFGYFAPDRMSGKQMYQKVTEAIQGNGEFKAETLESYAKRQQRFMLPKGTEEGLAFQMYFYVFPYKTGEEHTENVAFSWPSDVTPYGYPLERNIKFDSYYQDIPNGWFKEVHVYHQDLYEIKTPRRYEH